MGLELVVAEEQFYLQCEKKWVYAILMAVSGYLGAFTVILRGGVFCNAQTANFVFLAVEFGKGEFGKAFYYFIPIMAYLFGTGISEFIPPKIRKYMGIRWDTFLIGFEIVVIILLAFLPESAPVQISQIAINFICSMQYNTFRQAQSIPMATTFCTNHLRQTGIYFMKWLRHKEDRTYLVRFLSHIEMIVLFVSGGILSSVLCHVFLGKALLGAALLLMIVFISLLYADLTREKSLLDKIPAGH
ncbi:YoaK family protein [Anaerotignum sp.]|uniref:YoaK family protein n=1 Tax=Anaerotignum sp. TaxID=2039241 RepID=UPI0028AA5B9B|nr:YoaK family protein [Anaerotignum sp.]